MNAGSLFSGIGGLDLGVGVPPAWFCEYDKHCRTVLERHWPGVPIYHDIRELGADAARVDVLHGGYPCQPFSVAGKREGANDPRHLWPEFARLIRVLRPRVVVAENVAGHLRLGFHAVLADLAGLGMDVRWGVVRASDVGAPHQRARLFVVAHSTEGRDGGSDERGGVLREPFVAGAEVVPDSERDQGRGSIRRDSAPARAGQTTTNAERGGRDGRTSGPRRGEVGGVVTERPSEGPTDAQGDAWRLSDGDGGAASNAISEPIRAGQRCASSPEGAGGAEAQERQRFRADHCERDGAPADPEHNGRNGTAKPGSSCSGEEARRLLKPEGCDPAAADALRGDAEQSSRTTAGSGSQDEPGSHGFSRGSDRGLALPDAECSGRDGRAPEPGRSEVGGVAAQGSGEGTPADAMLAGAGRDAGAVPRTQESRRRQPHGGERESKPNSHAPTPADANSGRLKAGSQLDGEAEQDPADGHPRRRHADGCGDAAPNADDAADDGERSRAEPREGSAAPADSDLGRRDAEHERHVGLSDAAWGAYAPAIRRWERVVGDAPRPTDERGRLMPEFVEWMLGLPIGWTEGPARTHRLRMLGNAVVPQQAALAIRLLGGLGD